jgi:hypothetical protein
VCSRCAGKDIETRLVYTEVELKGFLQGAVKMLQTTSDGERFVHRELWQVVVGQLDQAKDKSGSFYNHLVAMVFAFHTLEAYVNFIAEKLTPELLERQEWGGFLSFKKKLQKLLEVLGLEAPDATIRPYTAVWELKALRDKIAHGRRQEISDVVEHPATEEPPWDAGFLEASVTPERVAIAVEDVESFAEWIHAAARRKLPDDVSLKQEALRGILQITSRTTTAAP